MSAPDFAVAILGGSNDEWRQPLCDDLHARVRKLSDCGEIFCIVSEGDLAPLHDAERAAAVVLGRGRTASQATLDAIAECRKRVIPLFPVVEDLARFLELVPELLAPYNGFELSHIGDIGELAGLVLEALGLQRGTRKIFISYARQDSALIAAQLREAFTARWYAVFHDTVSIRPSRDFQEELLQELADSDVMLLLNSASIKDRPYVDEEISFANLAGVGGVQVVWPGVAPRREAGFFARVDLEVNGRTDGRYLSQEGVTTILRAVAAARTDLQSLREEQLVRPIIDYATRRMWRAVHHLGRLVVLDNPSGTETIRLPLALGVPTSFDLERTLLAASPRSGVAHLVYDPLGLTERQADHLAFLESNLPLRLLDYKSPSTWRVVP